MNEIIRIERSFPLIYSPRLGINYQQLSNSFWSSFGHGYSNPSPEEALYPDGSINENLKQETGWQFEIGHQYHSRKNRLSLSSTFYYFQLQNLIVTKRLTEDEFMGINAGKTRHLGFENTIHIKAFNFKEFPGKLDFQSNFSISQNKFIEFVDLENHYDANSLPGIPNDQWSLLLFWQPLQNMSINLTTMAIGKQFLDDENSLSTNAYAYQNINLKYYFTLKNRNLIEFKFTINNLFNEHYASMIVPNAIVFNNSAPRYFYPAQPRNYAISIKFIR